MKLIGKASAGFRSYLDKQQQVDILGLGSLTVLVANVVLLNVNTLLTPDTVVEKYNKRVISPLGSRVRH